MVCCTPLSVFVSAAAVGAAAGCWLPQPKQTAAKPISENAEDLRKLRLFMFWSSFSKTFQKNNTDFV